MEVWIINSRFSCDMVKMLGALLATYLLTYLLATPFLATPFLLVAAVASGVAATGRRVP